MPGSLLSPRGVTRHESTRSDSSAASNTSQSSAAGNKKVSFNKAVRVKKYPRPKKGDQQYREGDGEEPNKRFWFRVYKSRPRPEDSRVIYYGNDDDVISYHPNPSVLNYPVLTSESGTQTARTALLGNEYIPPHPSQMPTEPPEVRRNYVKKIVNRFNEEAVLQRHRSLDFDRRSPSPPGSPRLHSTPKYSIPAPPPPPPPIPPSYVSGKRLPPSPEGLFGSRFKKNPIVNGVKVMFGMGHLKKKSSKSGDSRDSSPVRNGEFSSSRKGPYKTEIIISDGSETEVKTPYRGGLFNNEIVKAHNGDVDYTYRYDENGNGYGHYFDDDEGVRNGRSKYHVETWDSGNQLVFDTTDVNTSSAKTDQGEFISTVGEKHQLWKNDKRIIVYEEPSPKIIRRKAKSHTDLSHAEERYSPEEKMLDKGMSTDELFTRKPDKKESLTKKQKDFWLKHFRSSTKDKGIQCNKQPSDEPEELYGFGRYKIIRPRNGVVKAFSDVPSIQKNGQDYTVSNQANGYSSSAIYSQVDKSKKKRNSEKKKSTFSDEGRNGGLFKSRSEPLYIGPPPKNHIQGDYDDKAERKVKTSKRSFGFKINTGRDDDYREEDWYNLDGDVAAVEQQKRRGPEHRDLSEVRQDLLEEEISDASSLSNAEHKGGAGSVMREVDYKKREISYENVPRPEGDGSSKSTVASGLWYRDADEDYRREMAQSEVSYPAGSHVGSERFYTVDRKEKTAKKNPPPSPRAYTLDRRHLKDKSVPNKSGVKILVNGKEVSDKTSTSKKSKSHISRRSEDPSSVQSDPLYVRGGLAAAYQARQRSNVRRSNSSVSGLHRGVSPRIRRRVIQASSDISAASSESDSTRRRRPLVMYIPGISHPERPSENDDRSSGVNIARSQSMMTAVRPPRVKRANQQKGHHIKGSKTELYRNGDIYEEDEIMPLASDAGRKKPPKVPVDVRKQNNVKRSHSMPKDTKFSWLKWRIRGKPSREP